MYRRKLSLLGLIFFIAGCIASSYLALVIILARSEGLFPTIRTDSPENRFGDFRCPLLVSENESFTITATILKPTDTGYGLDVEADGFNILTMDEDVAKNKMIWTWDLTAVESGKRTFIVQALSHKDLARPGTFHIWPTSFLDSCGIFVIKSPLTGGQTLLVCLISLLVGAMLSFPRLLLKIRKRNKGKEATDINIGHNL